MTLATPLLDGIDPPGNSLVVWDRKIVYMTVAGSGCTAVHWMLADLAGEDLESFYDAPGAQHSRLMTVHGTRARWRRAVALPELSAEQLAEISVDNGWFVFTVVRDPWSRFWSAWQSTFLVRHTSSEGYAGESWYPSVASSQEQVVKDFRAFLDAEPWAHDPRLSEDADFLPQVQAVRPGAVSYSRVYDREHLDELFADLRSHLEAVGRPVDELYVPLVDETPLPLVSAVLEEGAGEVIAELYADDLAEYGDRWSLERLRTGPGTWSDDALKHAAYLTVANERIGDLSRQTLMYRRRWRRTTLRNQRLRQELRELQRGTTETGRAAGLRRRLVRRLRARRSTR